MAETTKERNYYWRWLVQIGRQARADVRELVVGLIIALAILLLQVHNGSLLVTDFRPDAVSTFWPYLTAIGLYVFYATIRAPLELDRERIRQIQDLDDQIVGEPTVAFEEMRFQHPLPNPQYVNVLVRMSISTGESPATLSGWALHSQIRPELKVLAAHVVGLGNHVGGFSTRLESHDSSSGRITFDFMGSVHPSEKELSDAKHRWTLEFSDAHRSYSVPIPEQLYGEKERPTFLPLGPLVLNIVQGRAILGKRPNTSARPPASEIWESRAASQVVTK